MTLLEDVLGARGRLDQGKAEHSRRYVAGGEASDRLRIEAKENGIVQTRRADPVVEGACPGVVSRGGPVDPRTPPPQGLPRQCPKQGRADASAAPGLAHEYVLDEEAGRKSSAGNRTENVANPTAAAPDRARSIPSQGRPASSTASSASDAHASDTALVPS